jgi:hypothetical protein
VNQGELMCCLAFLSWSLYKQIFQQAYCSACCCFMLVSCLAYSSTPNTKATCSSKLAVDFQWTTQHYIPEERILHNLNVLYTPYSVQEWERTLITCSKGWCIVLPTIFIYIWMGKDKKDLTKKITNCSMIFGLSHAVFLSLLLF